MVGLDAKKLDEMAVKAELLGNKWILSFLTLSIFLFKKVCKIKFNWLIYNFVFFVKYTIVKNKNIFLMNDLEVFTFRSISAIL